MVGKHKIIALLFLYVKYGDIPVNLQRVSYEGKACRALEMSISIKWKKKEFDMVCDLLST